ncbi:hypothetical protein PROFUN_00383 [Planoprotostelium fungivorum]|uniref:Fido domain-containing protein n=1 Tax=Planoprotostelium fungivorum TaxID=1890364 RepID=A0A2P6NY88_9EUKA|nr:hypothetical protein PROFUN_00383 [Planoprotostelium fungivorum]
MTKRYEQHLHTVLAHTTFLKKVFFRSETIEYDLLLEKISRGYQTLKTQALDDTDLVGSLQLLFCNYLDHVWRAEFPPDKQLDTEEIIIQLTDNDRDPTEFLEDQHVKLASRVASKIKNLFTAAQQVFGSDFHTYCDEQFSPDLAKRIHITLANGIIEDGGLYREKQVQASQSKVVYAPPETIEARMNVLFQFANQKAAECANLDPIQRTKEMFLVATVFLSEFLLIHPFSNGNGRTARLLLSFFLRDVTVVPFSLNHYISALEERNGGTPPSVLATLMLLSADQTHDIMDYLFK